MDVWDTERRNVPSREHIANIDHSLMLSSKKQACSLKRQRCDINATLLGLLGNVSRTHKTSVFVYLKSVCKFSVCQFYPSWLYGHADIDLRRSAKTFSHAVRKQPLSQHVCEACGNDFPGKGPFRNRLRKAESLQTFKFYIYILINS